MVILSPGLCVRMIGCDVARAAHRPTCDREDHIPGNESRAAAAGAPGTTPTIVAPWPPKEALFPSCTPRNAVAPMCTFADDLPEMICFAIVVALPMGIA